MTVVFRHADRRYPFLWESAEQPAARWHGRGDGPAQYLADTPDGAWAEFLRHEEITDRDDLAGVERNLWAIEVDEAGEDVAAPELALELLIGGTGSYPACRDEALRRRAEGASALRALPSAALVAGAARGQLVAGGLVEGADRDGTTLVLFGERPGLRGWLCCDGGRPAPRLLELVRSLQPG